MFEELETRRAEVERHNENSGRYAEAFGKYKSTGQGSIEFGDQIDFGLTFIEEPYMHYGAEIDLEELEDLAGIEPGTKNVSILPICSGFVTEWDRDENGYYTGAWVAVRVWFPYEANISPGLKVALKHHFTFKAVAFKDVPVELRD